MQREAKVEKQTYYVVTRSGELITYGKQSTEPKGYYVTTSRSKAIAKQKEILSR